MRPRKLSDWHWRRWFLLALMGYAVFYLSGMKPAPAQPPHYSYSMGSEWDDSVGWDPISLWKQRSLAEVVIPAKYQPTEWRTRSIASSKATGLAAIAGDDYYPDLPRTASDVPVSDDAAERQVTRTLTIHLLTADPVATAEKIRALATVLGGYVVTANTGSANEGEHAANISFRVPVVQLEKARASLRQLAIRVERERSEATDVTKEFVDRASTLRNYRAEEAQYLSVMKRAADVKDILEVSGKLSDVRGRIEKLQGELVYLSQQVQMTTITAYIDSELQAQVLGMRWRPWYRIKAATHDAIESLGEYFSLMAAFLLRLPAILLWIVTVFGIAGLAWRLLRWLAGMFFPGFHPGVPRTETGAVPPPAPRK